MIELTANVLFSGIGAQERGINNTGCYTCKVLNTSDIDKDATLAYAAIHCGLTKEMIENYDEYPSVDEMVEHLEKINLGYVPEKNKKYDWAKLGRKKNLYDLKKYWLAAHLSKNLGDIQNIKELQKADILIHTSPCQSFSIAGKNEGGDEGSGTRSSLMFESVRLIEQSKPKYVLWENVPNVLSDKHKHNFLSYLEKLSNLGYESTFDLINAKECGIPQNRLRIFCLSRRIDNE